MNTWILFQRYLLWLLELIVFASIASWLAVKLWKRIESKLDTEILSETSQLDFAEETIEYICNSHKCDPRCPCFLANEDECKYMLYRPWKWRSVKAVNDNGIQRESGDS